MIILGIDPGIAILGYGVISYQGSRLIAQDYGAVCTRAHEPFPSRLSQLYDGMQALIDRFKPDAIAFEELFFCKNVATAMQVGSARGVALLAAQQFGAPLYEYTPMQIKLAVTGNGHALKPQVQQMVKVLLNLKEAPKPDDVADALAVAICHANTSGPSLELFRIK